MFGLDIIVADVGMEYPREGDQLIMQVLFEMGYSCNTLQQLNQVRVFLQLLFLSDILTASRHNINPEVLSRQPSGEAWSRMQWPNECPIKSDWQLWREAMLAICPSWHLLTRVGHFIAPTHKVWRWIWNKRSATLCRASTDGTTKDAFVPRHKPNRFHFSQSQPTGQNTSIYSIEPTHATGGWRLMSMTPTSVLSPSPQNFLEVLQSWGNTWLWDHLLIAGGFNWLHEVMKDGTLVAVTDGSYIHKLYPNLCSAAFVMECAKEGDA